VVRAAFPVSLSGWRGRLRVGLLALVSGDEPAAGPGLAELLACDRERLHAAQNAFQQLLVLAGSLLIIQQARRRWFAFFPSPSFLFFWHNFPAARRPLPLRRCRRTAAAASAARRRRSELTLFLRPPRPSCNRRARSSSYARQVRQSKGLGWTAAQREAARRRLFIVTADPSMSLAALVTEVAVHAGAEAGVEGEAAVKTSLTSILSPTSTVYRAVRSNVGAALLAHLLHGGGGGDPAEHAPRATAALLTKVGASALVGDVAALAAKLATTAAVLEAVHGDLVSALCA
jgi:hypothetical protein